MPRSLPRGVAVVTVAALTSLTACTAPAQPRVDPTTTPPATVTPTSTPEVVTLTLASYAGMPLEDLADEYQRTHPRVRLELVGDPVGASSYRPTLEDDVGRTDLADVLIFSGDSLATVFNRADRFADLSSVAQATDSFPWALERGTDAEGRVLAMPLTIEPAALCFRGDLLADAGLASGRDEFAALLGADGGGWDTYFDVGRRYHRATGRAWFDQPELIWRAMVSQLHQPFTAPDDGGAPVPGPELRAGWDLLVAAIADGLSAHELLFSWDQQHAWIDGSFATFPCPPWALTMVEGNVTVAGGDASAGWDVADVFPGGGWTWGDTYVARAADTPLPAEATDLIAWLTHPDQQARMFPDEAIPSDRGAVADLAADLTPRAFFNDAPVGPIFASRAEQMPSGVVGVEELKLAVDAFLPALQALDIGSVDAADAWEQGVAALAVARP